MEKMSEFIFYYPFEYKAFESHFQKMAQKGWLVESISGNWLWNKITYVECVPSTQYFYTDFTSKNDAFMYSESDESKKYHSFIEEFGYHFICSYKGVLVFHSKESNPIEIREASLETIKELRKATYKSSAMLFFMFALFVIMYLLTMKFSSLLLSMNEGIFGIIRTFIVTIAFSILLFPILRWRIYPKKKYQIRTMKFRTYVALLGFFIGIFGRYAYADVGFALLIIICMFSMILLRFCKVSLYRKSNRVKGLVYGSVLLAWVFIFLIGIPSYTSTSTWNQSSKQQTIDGSFLNDALHVVNGDENSIHESVLMSTLVLNYESYSTIDIKVVKDTLLEKYIIRNIPYEKDNFKEFEKYGYKIYAKKIAGYDSKVIEKEGMNYSVMIQKGNITIQLENRLFKILSKEDMDNAFDAITSFMQSREVE